MLQEIFFIIFFFKATKLGRCATFLKDAMSSAQELAGLSLDFVRNQRLQL